MPRSKHTQTVAATLTVLAAVTALATRPAASQANGARYIVETVKSKINTPWTLRFAPNGALYYTSRDAATLFALNIRSGDVTEFSGLPAVRVEGEAGLLGLALDPAFGENHRVYMCYSYWNGSTPNNRLSRFTLSGTKLGGELKLIDAMPGWSNHNGCRVVVAPDGTHLFASMGDAAHTDNAQDITKLGGKTFRINLNGGIPADNPFPGSPVWSFGHRNPQGLAFQPESGWLWSTEHGPDTNDEVNIIEKGMNYGWPLCLGTHPCPGLKNYRPAIASFYEDRTVAPSGATFYTGKAFPAWKGDFFFVTLKTGRLYRLEPSGRGIKNTEILLDNPYGRLRDVTTGPDGFLYFSTDNGADSTIYRLRPKP